MSNKIKKVKGLISYFNPSVKKNKSKSYIGKSDSGIEWGTLCKHCGHAYGKHSFYNNSCPTSDLMAMKKINYTKVTGHTKPFIVSSETVKNALNS